jgi:putative addiction module component (TIGR02574 family)
MSIEQLEAEVLKLPANERARLAEKLLESLDEEWAEDPIGRAWLEEAQRRYEELRTGSVRGVPAEEALRKARERLG